MPLASPSEPALPAAWTDVLDRIQLMLADALRAAEARERALEAEAPRSAAQPLEPSDECIALVERAGAVPGCDELAAATERDLDAAQAALDRWLASAGQVAQRLAELATRAV
jgi:hypothetical protein